MFLSSKSVFRDFPCFLFLYSISVIFLCFPFWGKLATQEYTAPGIQLLFCNVGMDLLAFQITLLQSSS